MTDTPNITDRITEKLMAAMVAHEHHQTPVKLALATAPDLEKVGYPPRAIRVLANFYGPGADKARTLLPLAMRDGLIVLIGPTGRGKTVLATWLALRRAEGGKSPGQFLTAYELFARMKACWAKNEDPEAVLGKWKRSHFLVIDEAQTRAESVWENSVLDELVNYRYNHELPTVIIGNFDLSTAQKCLGPRIMDRANEAGGVVDCNWPSYRS